MNRREFLGRGGAAAAGALAILAAPDALNAAEPAERTRIRILYSLHAPKQGQPDWPNVGFDFVPVMDRINGALAERCRGFDFVTAMATGPEQAAKVVEEDNKAGNIDGYLVFQMNCWNQVVQTVAATGKPVLYADFQYGGSGGFLVYTAGFLRNAAPNVGFVASSRISDIVEAVNCFGVVKRGGTVQDFVAATRQARAKRTPGAAKREIKPDPVACLGAGECVRRLKDCRILAVADENSGPAGDRMGIPVENIAFAEVNDAWKNADRDEARAVAERWAKNAASVKGVSAETLETSAAMYLAQKAVMKKHGANAITINCLGGFYGGHIHAYPCLGFHELLNEGLIGACECDVRSAATMVAMTTLTQGRPGYISDPVIDTSKRQIIYAHCVASNRAFGPRGKANPFHILTHSEDRQGASVRSILPEGYMTTTVEFEPARKEVLFHQAVAVDNSDDDRACRTKLCGEPVGDVERLFTQWDQWGWHRVTVYGDLREPVFALADALGYRVVEEA
jgi:hypothetical protein